MTKKRFFELWDIFIILLSFYTVGEFFIELVVKMSPGTLRTFEDIDFISCMLFLADWFYYFFTSDDKLRFFKHHVIDLIASIPFAQILRPLRIARAIRIVRVLRLLRSVRGGRRFYRMFFKDRARSAMTIYLLVTAMVYLYGTLGIYNFERGVNKNIHHLGDAMWMAFTTLTMVGFSDCYPVTPEGRILCALLILTGMGLFSLLTAEFASYILQKARIKRP